ncbi:MAG: hypothetical protein ACK5OB_20865 [Pirellula sp.]
MHCRVLLGCLRWRSWNLLLAMLVLATRGEDAPQAWIRGEFIEVTEEQEKVLRDLEDRYAQSVEPLDAELSRLDKVRARRAQLAEKYEADTWKVLTESQQKRLLDRQRSTSKTLLEMNAPFLELMADWSKHALRAESIRIHEGFVRDEDGVPPKIDDSIPHRTIEGFPFRPEPVTLAGDVELELIQLAEDFRSYEPWAGSKMCGKFHPDFCVEIVAGQDHAFVLFCLTCGEADIVLPHRNVRVDLKEETLSRLQRRFIKQFPNRQR